MFFNLDFSIYELNVALSPLSLIMYSLFILLPILCSLRLWVSPRRFPINIDVNVAHACLLVTSFCYVLRVTVFPYFERLVNYFWIVSCVILVVMLIRFSRAQHTAIRAGVVGLSVIVMVGFSVGTKLRPSAETGIPGYYLYYPYANVVFPRESPERIRAAESRFNMDELEL